MTTPAPARLDNRAGNRAEPPSDMATVALPSWIINALALLVVVVSITGATKLTRGNYLDADLYLEIAFILLPVAAVLFTPKFRLHPQSVPVILILLFLLLIRGAIILFDGEAPLAEALRAHKWALFLILLALLMTVRLSSVKGFVLATKVLLVLAAAKYAIVSLLGSGERPALLRENNYEIALFCGMLVVTYPHLGRHRIWYVLALAASVTMSGSRSGIVTLIVAVLYLIAVSGILRHPIVAYGAVIAVGVLGYIAVSLFEARSSGWQAIDREKFFSAFLADTESWDLWTWLFGTHPISEISAASCSTLSYWANNLGIDADGSDGSCYSVVFHAFLIRAVYDFGLLGLILAFGLLWFILRQARVDRRLTLVLLGIALANSASVSGPNNVYVMFPFAFAILTAGIKPDDRIERKRLDGTGRLGRPVRLVA